MSSSTKAKILIIDDDKDITNLFAIFLESMAIMLMHILILLKHSITLVKTVTI